MKENLHRSFARRGERASGSRRLKASTRCARSPMSAFPTGASCAIRCLLTLARHRMKRRRSANCFDLFFGLPEPSQPRPTGMRATIPATSPPTDRTASDPVRKRSINRRLGSLAQMLCRRTDRKWQRPSPMPRVRHPFRYPVFYPARDIFRPILDLLGIARLRDDLDDAAATNPALAERLAAGLEGLRDGVATRSRVCDQKPVQ